VVLSDPPCRLTGVLDGRIGLQHIGADRRQLWARRLDAAEKSQPSNFINNGSVVEALRAAWSAITTTPVPQGDPAEESFASTTYARRSSSSAR
jgi:hypothetical protein